MSVERERKRGERDDQNQRSPCYGKWNRDESYITFIYNINWIDSLDIGK